MNDHPTPDEVALMPTGTAVPVAGHAHPPIDTDGLRDVVQKAVEDAYPGHKVHAIVLPANPTRITVADADARYPLDDRSTPAASAAARAVAGVTHDDLDAFMDRYATPADLPGDVGQDVKDAISAVMVPIVVDTLGGTLVNSLAGSDIPTHLRAQYDRMVESRDALAASARADIRRTVNAMSDDTVTAVFRLVFPAAADAVDHGTDVVDI